MVQEVHYDPFGINLIGLGEDNKINTNRFKFQGQEEMNEIGMYDFGNRMYDPSISHWNRPDRLADKYTNLSPYSIFGGNPLGYTDINGDSLMLFKNGSS